MARFYAEIKGSRGKATCMGTKQSGVWAHVRGWNVGVEIRCTTTADGRDRIYINRTGGSNSSSLTKEIAIVTEGEDA